MNLQIRPDCFLNKRGLQKKGEYRHKVSRFVDELYEIESYDNRIESLGRSMPISFTLTTSGKTDTETINPHLRY